MNPNVNKLQILSLVAILGVVMTASLATTSAFAQVFTIRMGNLYGYADLVVARAGATTIAELTALGLPLMLVPYPFAADNHQERRNRASWRRRGQPRRSGSPSYAGAVRAAGDGTACGPRAPGADGGGSAAARHTRSRPPRRGPNGTDARGALARSA